MAGMRLIKGNWGPIMTILITRLAAPTVTLHNQRRHALLAATAFSGAFALGNSVGGRSANAGGSAKS